MKDKKWYIGEMHAGQLRRIDIWCDDTCVAEVLNGNKEKALGIVTACNAWDDQAALRARIVELGGPVDCGGWTISLSQGQIVVTGPEEQYYAGTPDSKNAASAALFDFAIAIAFDHDYVRDERDALKAREVELVAVLEKAAAHVRPTCTELYKELSDVLEKIK